MRTPAGTPTEMTAMLRPRLRGAALPLLATALLLALAPAALSQELGIQSESDPLTITEGPTCGTDTGKVTYDVRLNKEPTNDVTVTVESSDTKTATVDTDTVSTGNQSTLTFNSGDWSDWKPVTIYCVNDDVDNPKDQRDVTITNTASGGLTSVRTVKLIVYDDDEAKLIVGIGDSTTSVTVHERGTGRTSSYPVKLATKPTGNVVVTVASDDPGAATVSPGSLTFTRMNWSTARSVTVSGVDDGAGPADVTKETKITHTPSGGGYHGGLAKEVTVTVTDTGTLIATNKGFVFSPQQPVVVEGGQATYTVRLKTRPTGTVTLDLSVSNVIDGLVSPFRISPNLLRFTVTNWNTSQSVTVTSVEDDYVDNDPDNESFTNLRRATITHQPSGGGYDGLADSMLKLTVGLRDNDKRGLLLSRKSVTLVDAGNTVSYTVALKSRPTATVNVEVIKSGAAVQSVSPKMLTFTTGNWKTRQPVTVTAQNDSVDNSGVSRSVSIAHSVTEVTGGDYGANRADLAVNLAVTVEDDDTAELLIDKTTLRVAEGSTQNYKVKLGSEPVGTVKVRASVPVGEAKVGKASHVKLSKDAGATYANPIYLTFTTDNWDEYQRVTVEGVEDKVDNDGNRTVAITHIAAITDNVTIADTDTRYVTGKKQVTVTITDDDSQSGIVLGSTSVKVKDSNNAANSPLTTTYTVKLRTKPGATTEVDLLKYPDDLAVDVPERLTFEVGTWNVPQTVTLTVTADDEDNGDRFGSIKHTTTGLTGAELKVTVEDDDDAEVIVNLVKGESSRVTEGDTVKYDVNLKSAPSAKDVIVTVLSHDPGIATVNEASRSLTFKTADWSKIRTVTVTGTDDDVDHRRSSRSVDITFAPSSGAGYGPGEAKTRTVTVLEDDVAKLEVSPGKLTTFEDGSTTSYTVKLATQPTGTVTVRVSSSNTAAATVKPETLTFRAVKAKGDTPLAYDSTQTVTVTGVRDAARRDRNVTISNTASGGGYNAVRASVAVTVREDETPGLRIAEAVSVAEGATATYGVELNTRPTGNVTVAVVSANSSLATVSPASLTFSTTNWNRAQQITVTAAEDRIVTGDREVTINHTSSGSSYEFDGAVKVTVTENDASLTPSVQTLTVAETGTGRFTARLTGRPTGNVVVSLASSAPTVATVSPATLTFTSSNYSRAQNVTVTAVDNRVDDPDDSRSATITYSFAGGGYGDVADGQVTVTVTDDERLVFSTSTVSVAEAGGTGFYAVHLNSAPTATVTVAVASGDPSAAVVAPAALTFTTANYATGQTITVTGVADDLDNTDDVRQVTVTHTPSGGGYRTAVPFTVAVTDDDAAPSGITLAVTPARVSENGGATPVTVSATLDGDTRFAVAQRVTVAVGASGDGATEGTDYVAVDDFSVTIASGALSGSATFTLTPTNDSDFEGDESITVAGTLAGVPVSPTSIDLIEDDTAPTLSIADVSVVEGGVDEAPEMAFVVTKTGQTEAVATVQYAAGTGSATAGTDYEALAEGTLTFAATESSHTVHVTVLGDGLYEEDETIVVDLSNPTNATLGNSSGTGTIENDDDDAKPTLSIADARVVEGGAGDTSELRFVVTKTGQTGAVATVDYADAGSAGSGTAASGSDYTALDAGTLTFAVGVDKQTISVTVAGDDTYEEDETVDIALSNATHADLTTATASGTIANDDGEPTLSISAEVESVAEGASGTTTQLLFTVTKGGAASEVTTTVDYAITGTATETDYEAPATGTLTFAPGATAQTISVVVQGDDTYEGDETVAIELSNATHGTIATGMGTASSTIEDDDTAPELSIVGASVVEGAAGSTAELVFTVTKSAVPTEVATTVDYGDAGSGTATSGDDYAAIVSGTLTFAPDETEKSISVTVQGDDFYEGDETVAIELSGVVHGTIASGMGTAFGTIQEDDTAPELSIVGASVVEGAAGSTVELVFTVTKTDIASSVVATTVAYSDAGSGTATSGDDYAAIVSGTLTFAPDETERTKTISVTVQGDDIYEGDETVAIALSGVTHGTIATGMGTASGTIQEDETAPALAIVGASVVEGAAGSTGELVFTVTKTDIASSVVATTVDYGDAGSGTATSGVDYAAIVSGTLTFDPGETEKNISVTVQGDDRHEENETVAIELRNATHGTIATPTASGTIENDDAAPTLAIHGATVAEGDAGDTTVLVFTVTKSGPTERVATVSYRDTGRGTATSGTDYRAVRAGTLTFEPDETTKTIGVTVEGDNEYEEDETLELELRNPSNATIAAGQGRAVGTITDDDPLPRVAKDWLARFGRGAADATLDAIARRMNDSAAVGESSLMLAGQQITFGPAPAAAHVSPVAEPWEDGVATVLTLEELANGSGFDLERSFAEGYLNVWGAGGYGQFEMTPRGTYVMDGSLMSAVLGVDHEGANHVLGLALAYHGGTGTFSGLGSGAAEGEVGSNLFSLHPYVRMTVDDTYHFGASIGFGTGDLRIEQSGGEVVELGAGMPIMAAADARVDLSLMETWVLAIQVDGSLVTMATAETDDLPAVEAGSSRLRLGLENSFAFLLGEGVSLAPVLDLGVRFDGGDAETGLGLDLGGALRLDATVVGLMVEARGKASLANLPDEAADAADEAPALRNWSVGGVVRWRPTGTGMGPQVSLAPSWGGTGITGAAGLNAEVGYGLPVFGNGVLTPYGAAEFAGDVPGVYHLGARLKLDHGLQLSAAGTHEQGAGGTADQFFTVQLQLLR